MYRRTTGSATLLGLALAGIVLGHGITYAGLAPVAVAREAWLAATGHGYLPAAASLAFGAAMIVFGAAFLRGLTDVRSTPTPPSPWRRLIAFEAVGFVLLEVVERVASGAGFADLVSVLPAGLVIQAAIGAALAAAVVALRRAGSSVAAGTSAAPPSPRRALILPILAPPIVAGRIVSAPVGGRAPPPSP